MDEMKLLHQAQTYKFLVNPLKKFLREALKVSRKGWGQPAMYNSEAILAELSYLGKSVDDARESGICSGCVEVGVAGKEAYVLTGYLNIPKVFELAMNRGYDHYTDKQVGIDVGDFTKMKTYEEVLTLSIKSAIRS